MKMRTRLLIGGSLVAFLAAGTLGIAAVGAQEKQEKQERKEADWPSLVKRLGADDFAARSKAYEELEAAGPAALGALEEGAKSEDAQVRWSAARLLRRLSEGREEREPRGVLRFGEEAGPGPGWPDLEGALRDMGSRMEEIRRRFQDLRGGFRFEVQPGLKGSRIERHVVVDRDGERVEAHVAADGRVTVKIARKDAARKDANGKAVEETYEAKDMDALEKEHPDVADKVKGLLGGGVLYAGPGAPNRFGTLDDLFGDLRRGEAPARPALGVTVSEVPPVLRTQLSVPEGEGLVVEEVLPDTPAARLGLKRHDVILSVNGSPVSSAADVRAAMGAVKEGGEIRLRVLRGGKADEIAGTR